MTQPLLNKTVFTLLLLILAITGLYYAKEFLVPIAFAGILAMLLLPISRKLEGKGWNRGLSVLASVLVLLTVLAGIITLLAWQLNDLAQDIERVQGKLNQFISSLQEFISDRLSISKTRQDKLIEDQQSSSSAGGATAGIAVLKFITGFFTNVILVMVYIFLFMFFRSHLKKFILKLVPSSNKTKTLSVIDQSCHVSQKYLGGLAAMIFCLWIMYGIGFTIVGVKNAFFFAVLCGLLEIVPFIGNLTGTGLTILMVVVQGGGGGMVMGVIITYGIVQFIQTYLLEPLVVGAEVNINPLFTILALVLGELLWGIPGMVLAIPLTGILKIIMENIESLQPYAFLIGENKTKKDSSLVKKLKGFFVKNAATH